MERCVVKSIINANVEVCEKQQERFIDLLFEAYNEEEKAQDQNAVKDLKKCV